MQQASKQVRGGDRGAWRSETGMLITLQFDWGLLVLPCAPFNWACIELQAGSVVSHLFDIFLPFAALRIRPDGSP